TSSTNSIVSNFFFANFTNLIGRSLRLLGNWDLDKVKTILFGSIFCLKTHSTIIQIFPILRGKEVRDTINAFSPSFGGSDFTREGNKIKYHSKKKLELVRYINLIKEKNLPLFLLSR